MSGTDSGTVDAIAESLAAELTRLVKVWPELPAAIRAGIMAMVDAAHSDRR